MTNTTELTTQLENLNTKIFTPEVNSGLESAIKEQKALNVDLVGRAEPASDDVAKDLARSLPRLTEFSALPRTGEEKNNGLKALSSVYSDFPESPELNVPKHIKGATTTRVNLQAEMPGIQRPLAEITEDLPISSSKIKPDLSGSEKGIAGSITGSEVTNSFNNIALVLPTPQATAESINAISVATNAVAPDAQLVVSTEIGGTLSGALGNLPGELQQYAGVFNAMQIPDLRIPNIGSIITGKLSDVVGKLSKNLNDIIRPIVGSPVLDVLHNVNNTVDVVRNTLGLPISNDVSARILAELTNGSVSNALGILQSTPSLQIDISVDASKYEEKLIDLQNKYGAVGSIVIGTLADRLGITNLIQQVSGLSLSIPVMNNFEEGYAEMISSPTPIQRIQVGWTETYKDDVVTRDTIVPQNYYHYIVLKNGVVQRSKAIGSDEEIKIAIVGGYNVNRGESGVLTESSITFAQTLALKQLLEQLLAALPGAEVYGVGQVALESNSSTGSYLDPGVDISQMVKGINGQNVVPSSGVGMAPRGEDLGLPTSPYVIYAPNFDVKTRNGYIQKDLMNILINVGVQVGFYMTIVSGGQMSLAECKARGGYQNGDEWFLPGQSKPVRTGSVRHDNGWAADLTVYRDASRTSVVNFGTNNADIDALRFVRACRAAGIQAIGAGPGYMGSNIHVDIAFGKNGAGATTAWGKKNSPVPTWLTDIMV